MLVRQSGSYFPPRTDSITNIVFALAVHSYLFFALHVFDKWWIHSSEYSGPMTFSSSYSRKLSFSSTLASWFSWLARRKFSFLYVLRVLLFVPHNSFLFERFLGSQLIYVIYSLVIFSSFVSPAKREREREREKRKFNKASLVRGNWEFFFCFLKILRLQMLVPPPSPFVIASQTHVDEFEWYTISPSIFTSPFVVVVSSLGGLGRGWGKTIGKTRATITGTFCPIRTALFES